MYRAFKVDICEIIRGSIAILWFSMLRATAGSRECLFLKCDARAVLFWMQGFMIAIIVCAILNSKRAGYLYPEDRNITKAMAW